MGYEFAGSLNCSALNRCLSKRNLAESPGNLESVNIELLLDIEITDSRPQKDRTRGITEYKNTLEQGIGAGKG